MDHLVYHGQLPNRYRREVQEEFLKAEAPMILATPAFGLGIDKPNVRLLIHAEIPGSVEAYFQEIGRAGRDGINSQCVLLYDPDDVSISMDFIKWANPGPKFIHQVYYLIDRNQDRIFAEGLDFLRTQLNYYNRRDYRVETAVNLLERWGCIERSDKHRNKITSVEPPPMEYMDDSVAEQRLKRQNEKLLKMVQLAQLDGDYKAYIYEYFGVNEGSIQK